MIVRRGIIGMQRDGLVEVGDRPVVIALTEVGVAAVDVGARSEIGIEPDRLIEVVNRPVEIALVDVATAAGEVGGSIVRIEREYAIASLDRFVASLIIYAHVDVIGGDGLNGGGEQQRGGSTQDDSVHGDSPELRSQQHDQNSRVHIALRSRSLAKPHYIPRHRPTADRGVSQDTAVVLDLA
jgi:hypothetical protein